MRPRSGLSAQRTSGGGSGGAGTFPRADPAPAAYEVVLQSDVPQTMRDGTTLYADVYLPGRAGEPVDARWPTVLVRTSYDKSVPGHNLDPERFVRRGYAVMLQDVRGRYRSEGVFYHGVAETDDGYDTLEWIAAQPWSDGKVGMTGVSYLAAVQCAAAISGSPHLAAVFHVKAPPDYYQSGNRHGGNAALYMAPITFMFASTSREAQADPVLERALLDAFANGREWLARLPIKRGRNPLAATPGIEGWLADIMEHADYDDFWKRVPLWQPVEYVDEYADVPAYYVSGWFDMYHEERFYELFAGRKRGPIKLLMGPWTHLGNDRFSGDADFGPDAELSFDDYNELQLRFFDRALKGLSEALDDPPVRIFVMGGGSGRKTPEGRIDHGGRWRDEHEWPLARAVATRYHLHPGGLLATEPPPADGGSTTYAFDPADPVPTIGGTQYFISHRDESMRWQVYVPYAAQDQRERPDAFGCRTSLPLSSRHDVVVFETPPLAEDVEVTGTPVARLWVSSSAVDTDFTAKLIDVYPRSEDYPDGYAMNVSDGILRARYRNSFERAELLTPGEPVELVIELYATSNLFMRGHRIRVDVSSSDWPAYDVNPNHGGPIMQPGRRPVVAENTIHHCAERPSCVVVPIVAAS